MQNDIFSLKLKVLLGLIKSLRRTNVRIRICGMDVAVS